MDSTDKANNSPLGPARDRSTDSAVPVHSVGSAPRKVSSDFPPHHEVSMHRALDELHVNFYLLLIT